MSLFGKKIRKIRTESNKTLREVSEILKIQLSYLSDVEHGRKKPFTPDVLLKFVAFFKCDPIELETLASKERDTVEISLNRGVKLNRLAFTLARSNSEDDVWNELEQLIEERKNEGICSITKE